MIFFLYALGTKKSNHNLKEEKANQNATFDLEIRELAATWNH